jgi:hypothetical protein
VKYLPVLLIIVIGIMAAYIFTRDNGQAVDYKKLLAQKDSIIRINHTIIEGLHFKWAIDSLRFDSLTKENKKIDTLIIYTQKKNDEKYNHIRDTASVNFIRRYFANELIAR